ncbi:DUF3306 domain-containing protein [Phreatobacter aquaticus]|uniref:DUF3306 domain-containing protein n=1 Tax=Phreatobacter aquaticus TaxID=2570229 RepID=A0A4D7QS85_9HYPH|nr:DUF3306 domain-containing protein [Phreatobacter aquaticus]QCK86952.1 DUF3306 domain-containing protein [Phreatobacter aquaticus]
MSGSDEGFLSRWSRLKREPEPEAPEVVEPPPAPASDLAKSVEEIVAALPRIEDLLPGQSLSGFMQAGVPVDLKNAALRRMWTIDPAIRDFVGEALDYAYDYNTPGGAPGFGPMITSPDQVNEVLAMFDKAMPKLTPDSRMTGDSDNLPQHDDVTRKADLADAASQQNRAGLASQEASLPTPMTVAATEPAPALDFARAKADHGPVALQEKSVNSAALPSKSRRHGSALPH